MKKIIFLIPLLIICQVAYADVVIQNDQKYIDNGSTSVVVAPRIGFTVGLRHDSNPAWRGF